MRRILANLLAVILVMSAVSAFAAENTLNLEINNSNAAIRYVGYEYVPENFYTLGGDASKTVYVKFEYTNKTEEAKNIRTDFSIVIEQKGAALDYPRMFNAEIDSTAFMNYLNGTAQNETVPVYYPVVMQDYSPLTITVSTVSGTETVVQSIIQEIAVPEGVIAPNEAPVAYDELQGDWINITNGNTMLLRDIVLEKNTARGQADIKYSNVVVGVNGRNPSFKVDGDIIKIEDERFRIELKDDKLYLTGLDTNDIYMKTEQFYRFEDIDVHDVGDSIMTDEAEFTLMGFDYADSVDAFDIGAGVRKDDRFLIPDNGMIWMRIPFKVFNVSTKTINMLEYGSVRLNVVYRNKFSFRMENYNWIVIGHGGDKRVRWMGTYYGNGTIDLNPLTNEDYDIWIPVPAVIRDDATSPIHLLVILAKSDGSELFAYKLQ